MNSRLMSLLLVLVLVVSLLPVYSAAADTGKVRVIVENTTARDPEYQGTAVPWRDQLFDIFVDYTDGLSMMRALEEASSAYLGGEDPYAGEEPFLVNPGGYISEINGLGMLGSQGGWMATLNDWFADTGMDACMVQPGDTIRVMYTLNWGADIGGDWFSTDTGLDRLSFSVGALYPAFSHDVTDYKLYVPADVEQVRISPSAANKNHKVILTSGNEKNVRWGARTFPSDCGTVTVQVDNGMQYHVQIVPCEVITSLLAGCDGGSKCPSAAFRDVDRSAESWYHEAVDWAVAKKVTNGVSENSFAPDASCTRA